MTKDKALAVVASSYNMYFGQKSGVVMTPKDASDLSRGDKMALCMVLEQRGGSDLYNGADARSAYAYFA